MLRNIDVKQYGDVLFAHTASFNHPAIFAGRLREQEDILKGLAKVQTGSGIILSAALGSGKTFLLQQCREKLRAEGYADRDDKAIIVSIRGLTDNTFTSRPERKILIIDEIDRKMTRKELLDKLAVAERYVGKLIPYLILSGDQNLKDPDLTGILSKPIKVDLDPLSEELFFDAMEKRVGNNPDTQAHVNTVRDTFPHGFIRYLIPKTSPPVATFREVLSILASIAKSNRAIPLNYKSCVFSEEVCRAWCGDFPRVTDDERQIDFLIWLRDYIRKMDKKGSTFKELTTEEFRKLCPLRGIKTASDYEAQVLEPLSRANFLRGTGIPYKDGTGEPRRDPGPYLPTPMTFLRSMYDEEWP